MTYIVNNTFLKKFKLKKINALIALGLMSSGLMSSQIVYASPMLEEITVTSRHREESLQEVPIAITSFGEFDIENAGITDIDGFINLTPNFISREAFRAGVTFLTIRGITTGQQGFAPISYTVDGVKASSLDAINQGALFDLERIEVLKGPQSALYGAGAIAGAVNVITKKPTNETEGQVTVGYAEGDDKTLKASISGAIKEDVLTYRLSSYVRDFGGLVETTTGDKLDFEDQKTIKGRLIYTPTEAFGADFRLAYTDFEAGAAKQERIANDQVNTFNKSTQAERGIIGKENREILDASVKFDIELPFATLTTVTGFLDMDQDLMGSASWARPPSLGEPAIAGLFGPILGANAVLPNDIIDSSQDLLDNIESFSHDMRLTSSADGAFRWVVGFEYIKREITNGLILGNVTPASARSIVFTRKDERTDKIFGGYFQLNYDISDKMELAFAGRYDKDEYSNRQLDALSGALINQIDKSGNSVSKLEANDAKFQPQVTLSYDWSEDVHGYVSYSEGYRFGFFNTGNLTSPEETVNYELGFKSTIADGSAILNGAIFIIDYSNQQSTSIIPTPPFRVTDNIPDSDIKGIELELTYELTADIGVNVGLGYLDTEINGLNRELDAVPSLTANFSIDYVKPLNSHDLELFSRLDWRYQDKFLLNRGTVNIHAVNLVNLRLGVRNENWTATAYIKNALDEQFATDPVNFGAFTARSFSSPSQAGVEVRYSF